MLNLVLLLRVFRRVPWSINIPLHLQLPRHSPPGHFNFHELVTIVCLLHLFFSINHFFFLLGRVAELACPETVARTFAQGQFGCQGTLTCSNTAVSSPRFYFVLVAICRRARLREGNILPRFEGQTQEFCSSLSLFLSFHSHLALPKLGFALRDLTKNLTLAESFLRLGKAQCLSRCCLVTLTPHHTPPLAYYDIDHPSDPSVYTLGACVCPIRQILSPDPTAFLFYLHLLGHLLPLGASCPVPWCVSDHPHLLSFVSVS